MQHSLMTELKHQERCIHISGDGFVIAYPSSDTKIRKSNYRIWYFNDYNSFMTPRSEQPTECRRGLTPLKYFYFKSHNLCLERSFLKTDSTS